MADGFVVMFIGADPVLLRHLEQALVEHRRWCRTNGIDWPKQVEQLFDGVLAARSGHTRPQLASSVDVSEDGSRPLVVDYDAAADRLMVSPRTVRRLVADGRLPAVDVGGCKRIRLADLDAYVEAL